MSSQCGASEYISLALEVDRMSLSKHPADDGNSDNNGRIIATGMMMMMIVTMIVIIMA